MTMTVLDRSSLPRYWYEYFGVPAKKYLLYGNQYLYGTINGTVKYRLLHWYSLLWWFSRTTQQKMLRRPRDRTCNRVDVTNSIHKSYPIVNNNTKNVLHETNDSICGYSVDQEHELYTYSIANVTATRGTKPLAKQQRQQQLIQIPRRKRRQFRGRIQWNFLRILLTRNYWLIRLVVISGGLVLCFLISQQTLIQMSQQFRIVPFVSRITLLNSSISSPSYSNHPILRHRTSTSTVLDVKFSIILPRMPSTTTLKRPFLVPHISSSLLQNAPDFGGINLRISEDVSLRQKPRIIYHDYHSDMGYDALLAERQDNEDDDGNIESYYAFDDDIKRNPYVEWDDPDIHKQKQCRRTSWHRELPITCNTLHEFDFPNHVLIGDTKYLRYELICFFSLMVTLFKKLSAYPSPCFYSVGAYRQVFLNKMKQSNETMVIKMFSLDSQFNYEDYEFVRMDAIVNEKLNDNPRIVSMYSYCGLSMTSEAMVNGDLEHYAIPTGVGRVVNIPKDEQTLTVRNTLSGTQKLKWSLDMAEAVLLLHAYHGGVIVHDDIQPSQFLVSSTGSLMLNDFNRAEIMLYNEKDNEYCKYRNHPGGGDVSAYFVVSFFLCLRNTSMFFWTCF
jgi:hypothetical protein